MSLKTRRGNMLKKARTVFALFLFSMVLLSVFSNQIISDKSKIPRLRWTGPGHPGTYEEYLSVVPRGPLYLQEISAFRDIPAGVDTEKPRILIFVNSTVYAGIPTKISRYAGILEDLGYEITLFTTFGGTPEGVKTTIQSNSRHLLGCVFIGNVPSAWYEVPNDYDSYGYAEFPCDLYYMDLDGEWLDTDMNGKYDIHQSGSGDRSPEIFIGRIDASLMPGNEIVLLNSYFDKNHVFWASTPELLQYGLTYTEDDWAYSDSFKHDISHLFSSYEPIWAPSTNRDDYTNIRLKSPMYAFVQLACHSSSSGHYFTRGGWLFSDTVKNTPPQGLGYNLFCCSSLRYTDNNYLGGAYIFNNGQKTMAVIGSTKTGSMLEFEYFYTSLGENNPIGIAFKEWFESIAPYNIWDVYWHYGMTITGDPLITFLGRAFPPLHVSGSKKYNRSLSQEEYISVLSWSPNPKNHNLDISGYRIYEKAGESLIMLKDVSAGTTEYLHRNIEKNKTYTYAVAALNSLGYESVKVFIQVQ